MSGLDPEIQLPITLPLDDHAGPAPRVSQDHLQSMVAAALVEFDQVHASGSSSSERSAGTASMKPTPWMVAAGAALAVVGGVAAARFFSTPEPKQLPTMQSQAAPTTPPAAATPAALPLPAADELDADGDLQDSDQNSDNEGSAAASDEGAGSARSSDRGRHAAALASRSSNAPEDLLQKANQLRAAGRFRNAEETYSLVYDRFPKTQAAYVARVAAAALELEHLSNPLKARKLFEQALQDRPRGALDLEARQGLSTALRDLEDRAGERDALRSLIARHPGSPAARRAQVRLMELGGE